MLFHLNATESFFQMNIGCYSLPAWLVFNKFCLDNLLVRVVNDNDGLLFIGRM
jgi:hypothetical protein